MSDRVWAAEVVDGQVLNVPREKLAERLSQREGFMWMHVLSSDPNSLNPAIKKALQTCPLTFHDLTYEHLRSGIEQRGDTIAFLSACPQRGDEVTYTPLGVVVSPTLFITMSPRSCPAVEGLFGAWEDDPDDIGTDAASVLHSLIDAVIDEYFPILDDCHAKAEDLEATVYAAERVDPTGPLTLKRELLVLRKQIGPLRDTLNALMRFGAPLIPPTKLPEFNDLLNHCLRITENVDLGRDIVSSIMDAQLGVVSNRLNEVMRTLTVISTLLMVCSLIAGIYGMNFKRLPELDWTYGYAYSLGLMAVACGVVVWLFKRNRWL